ncbi:protease inhibitor I42 family protein [Aquiflexum sp. TKW24L]|uniref:protease inhibitor I42 family protein n=1 Tax=Aquiflexum sp. TKW24L TaxID=2942212 RepID=UPI0020BD7EE6|nr:protease inhibitor I42 family protein [Aquiflexum sp. TKW24L]MCL6260963.1 protease inhibitor I42 family protein [Aquiflexum sp. TKW24L]
MVNKILEINENWHGQTVTLNKGDYLNITLLQNPSTGFSWEISEIDDTLLKVTEDSNSIQLMDKIGGPVQRVLQLHALNVGTSCLEIIYKRPWEMDPPEKKIFLEMVVQ